MEFISVLIFVLCVFSCTRGGAQEEINPGTYTISAVYSPLDFPIPNKWGITGGVFQSASHRWELEYLKGGWSIPGGFRDLGSVEDTRIGIIRCSYPGKTFYFSYGINYFDFSANLGEPLLRNLTSGVSSQVEAMSIQGFGLSLGIGNRWIFKNRIMFGIDWLTWAQPLLITKKSSDFLKYVNNENDKKNVEDTMRIVSYVPRFAALTLRLGVVF